MNPPQSSTYKKAVVRKLDRDLVKGFVIPSSYLGPEGVEMMDLKGRRTVIPLDQVKGVYFVRDFEGDNERVERKTFLSRPKLNGLWIRMTFVDDEVLDGLLSENLLEIQPEGYLVTPPDVFSNNLKIFVPRTALQTLEVRGVISNGSRRGNGASGPAPRKPRAATRQMRLFSS